MPGLPFEQTPVAQEDFFTTTINSAYTLRGQELRQEYQDNLALLDMPRDKQIGQLKNRYRLKEYQLQRAYMADEDFQKQMGKLIDKYELDALKIQQKQEMGLEQAKLALQQDLVGEASKLDAKHQQTLGQIQTINYLASVGKLPKEEAEEELYKLVGITYKPRTTQQEFQEVDAYIKDLEGQFRNYFPGKRGAVEFTRTGFKEDARPATEQETVDYYTILNQLAVARRRRGEIQSQVYGRQLSVARLQNAYMKKANRSYNRGRQHLENQTISRKVFTEKFMETGKSPTALTAGVLQAIKRQSPVVSLASKLFDVEEPKTTKTQRPVIQRNKRTGEERISYDGGKTWQMIG